ncbi:MAG TPA: TonB-dependent receptor, partial [Gracilimonas sp.]|uniref:TonB-dependent receptor n=1 Tax=Gracilimonas sp. TaxID=1974203 RepID=UPI002D8871D6|nr:TonB-dependent receptor [Gracilimonas sp.]
MKSFITIILLSLVSITGNIPALGQDNSFTISGQVVNSETSEGISFAYLHIEELNRTSTTDVDGNFELLNIPTGTFTLTIHRIGFRTQSRIITIEENLADFKIQLSPTVLSTQSIEVVGEKDELDGSGLEHASKNVFGNELRRNLGSTLSQTLSNLPGFDQRTNGSAPGRPVIRGLGGERVVILQDGMSTGDISAQSSDHAVTTDPSSADEIEIARGPAALAYGSNAIGGVINIVKNQISTTLPSKVNGSFSASGETVNRGGSGALSVQAPYKNFAFQVDLSGRIAKNTRTPLGPIKNTFFQTTNDGIGISYIQPWGYIGASGTLYKSNYGIPPDPNGHTQGVDIEMNKLQYDLKSEVILKDNFFKVLDTELSYKDYNHKEIEGENALGQPVVGTEFDLLTTNFNVRAKHRGLGFIDRGSIGITTEYEDYEVFGAGTPPSQSVKAGAYLIEEADFNALHLEAGLRFDFVKNITDETGLFYPVGVSEGIIDSSFYKNRTFTALASSFAAIYQLGGGFSAGGSFIHSFRAPSLEELYSEGPHLASYSFEIGNPDLDPERALGKEVFIRFNQETLYANFTVFHNDFSNYLYARNTGRQHIGRSLQDYQFVGTEAVLYGAELSGEIQFLKHFVFDASMSY